MPAVIVTEIETILNQLPKPNLSPVEATIISAVVSTLGLVASLVPNFSEATAIVGGAASIIVPAVFALVHTLHHGNTQKAQAVVAAATVRAQASK